MSLVWRSLKEYNLTDTESCRNSVQGINLVTDERGFICQRNELLPTGCCSIPAENTHLYDCTTCNEYQCCKVFEHCVSCCLNPDNVSQLVLEFTELICISLIVKLISHSHSEGPHAGEHHITSERSTEDFIFTTHRSI